MLRAEEALLRRMVEKRQQRIEVSGHVEDAVRFPVQTELPPRPDLEELLEAAQAAGRSTKASASSDICCLRSCIEWTTRSSVSA